MPTLQKDFEISAAGGGCGDADQYLTLANGGQWEVFERHALRSV
jgi:hypothetical protein